MNLPESEIARIVQQVVNELTSGGVIARDDSEMTGRLEIDASIVSLDTISGRLDGISSMIVRRQAVVTPAARDLLKERNVALVRASGDKTNSDGEKVRRVAIVRHSDKGEISQAMLDALFAGKLETIDHSTPCVFRAVDWALEQISQPTTLAVMTTKYTDIALCAANRHVELRAVAAGSPDRVRQAVASVGANLLILPCGSIAMPGFRAAIRQYVEAGPWQCPAALNELNDRK